ncbi:MAG: hypothetical protein J1F69_04730 [Clostridiales bacterium]|nr:hypothetical protein [Clostridiales bacterium]
MNNTSNSPVTEMLSGKYKIWLIVGLSLLSAVDLTAIIVFLAGGYGDVTFAVVPMLALLVNLAYLIGVLLSNQRFKYARRFFVAYIAASVLLFIAAIIRFSTTTKVVYVNTVVGTWEAFHLLGIAAAVVTYLYAARLIKRWRTVQFAAAVAFSCVLVSALGIFHGVYLIKDGYFGQGTENRALIYSYTENDTCAVTGVVGGKGNKVVVPYEFNGRKVTTVSAAVLSGGIKSVTLNCDCNTTALFVDIDKYWDIASDLVIKVDKKDVDVVKKTLYNYANNGIADTFDLGNLVRPTGLKNNEVCITFDYDIASYSRSKGNIIPTWYGKKGDVFRLNDIDLDYVRLSDTDSDEHLYARFNANGYIMSELKADSLALDGMAVNKNCYNVPVSFQKVYKVYVGQSNDTMYDASEHFTYSVVDGRTRDYKLTVAEKADALLTGFNRGEAFNRTVYTIRDSYVYEIVYLLSETLKFSDDRSVTIAPYWSLALPDVTISSANGSTDVIYGDAFTLTADVTHPLSDFQVEYEWRVDGVTVDTGKTMERKAADGIGVQKFTAVARITAPQTTSLYSANAAEININRLRRPLTVKWTDPDSNVFDGTEKTIRAELQNIAENHADVDYYIRLEHDEFTQKNASTQTHTAYIVGFSASFYYIASGKTHTYTILPRPTPVTWNNDTEFTYDGNQHMPSAQAFGIGGGELGLRYSGGQTDAGDYTVTVQIVDTDYTIDGASSNSKQFKILPKQVDVTWGDTVLTYNGALQAPAASADGVKGAKVNLAVTGGRTDANIIGGQKKLTYTATAASQDKNYTVNPATSQQEFTIAQLGVEVEWRGFKFTYNGDVQVPQAIAQVENGKLIALSVEGGAMNVGKNYSATAKVPNDNYVITSGETTEFSIEPCVVSVRWGNVDLIYNGQIQTPSATATGVKGEDLPLSITGGIKDYGLGTARAYHAAPNDNYALANTEKGFTVSKKTLTATVYDVTIAYGEKITDHTFTCIVTGIVPTDSDVTAYCVVDYKADDAGNIPEGVYDIYVGLRGENGKNYSITFERRGKLTVTAPPEPIPEPESETAPPAAQYALAPKTEDRI